MLFREIIAVYFENHMKHVNTLRGENSTIFIVVASGTYTGCFTTLGHNCRR
jgi:hypothetical protein